MNIKKPIGEETRIQSVQQHTMLHPARVAPNAAIGTATGIASRLEDTTNHCR
jgi:hypothetical protein